MNRGGVERNRAYVEQVARHARERAHRGLRWLNADRRPLPDFVVIGTQRGGTTALYDWLARHPQVRPALRKEIHYFDGPYQRHSLRWYRAHFPFLRHGEVTGEASPYMLFHPLAPERAARDLPERTRFIALLREPVRRTLSQYRYWKKLEEGNQGVWETESLERALELEESRLAAATEQVRRGQESPAHVRYSYVARSEYAPQLRRWFDAVGRERVLVLESERLWTDPAVGTEVLDWLGLPPHPEPLTQRNETDDTVDYDPALVERLRRHFEPCNEELFRMLGRDLWTDLTPTHRP